jgi:hypothetical protein
MLCAYSSYNCSSRSSMFTSASAKACHLKGSTASSVYLQPWQHVYLTRIVMLSFRLTTDCCRKVSTRKFGMHCLCLLHWACVLCLVDICSYFPRDKETIALDLTLTFSAECKGSLGTSAGFEVGVKIAFFTLFCRLVRSQSVRSVAWSAASQFAVTLCVPILHIHHSL